MSVLNYAELLLGFSTAAGASVLVLVASTRTPKLLHDEIALSIERSIDAIQCCDDRPRPASRV